MAKKVIDILIVVLYGINAALCVLECVFDFIHKVCKPFNILRAACWCTSFSIMAYVYHTGHYALK